MKINYVVVCAAVAATTLFAQSQKKAPASPPAETSVSFDGKIVSIKYSAPSLRGRQFIGGLHQYGQVWRAGANNATALHTESDLDIGGLTVPKGDYTLYVLLDPTAWQLVVNGQTGQWGTVYNQDKDLGRVKMTMSKPDSKVETFKISLAQQGKDRGQLRMEWENSVATVPFRLK